MSLHRKFSAFFLTFTFLDLTYDTQNYKTCCALGYIVTLVFQRPREKGRPRDRDGPTEKKRQTEMDRETDRHR